MSGKVIQLWVDFFWLLAGELQVKGIRAEVEIARPLGVTDFGETDLLENARFQPGSEDAFACVIRQIDDPAGAVLIAKEQLVTPFGSDL